MAVGNLTTTNTYRLTDANTYNMQDANTYLLVDVSLPDKWERNADGPNPGGSHLPQIKQSGGTKRIERSGG